MAKIRTSQRTEEFAQALGKNFSASGSASTPSNPQISTAYSTKDPVGMIIHRVEYEYSNVIENLNTTLDAVRIGLSTISQQAVGGHNIDTAGVIDWNRILRIDYGTAAEAKVKPHLLMKDFSTLPKGGILVHPAFLYAWAYTEAALTGAAEINLKLWYTIIALSDKDYLDLWQNMIITSTI
jgi:hypothetical protein